MLSEKMLPMYLKQLRLGTMRNDWQETAELAKQMNWTYEQYLTVLCDRELANREQNRINRFLIESKIPVTKTLDAFNFKKCISVNGAQIRAFAEDSSWIDQAENLILFGPSGVGKTHLAAAIGRSLILKGIRVLFANTTSIVQSLQKAYKENNLSNYLNKLSCFQLLILDDIGYAKKNETETNVLFELIASRYEAQSLLITANQPFDQWGELFSNTSMAIAAIDRIVHHATIININEESYRRKSKDLNGQ